MSDPEMAPVTLSEFKQSFFRWSNLLAPLWVGVWFLSRHQLRSPNLAVETRLFWCLAPLPLMALAFWRIFREAQSKKEMERRVSAEAAGYAFPLTIVFYAGMGLINLGFPIAAETWATSFIFPMLIYVACSVLILRRYIPR